MTVQEFYQLIEFIATIGTVIFLLMRFNIKIEHRITVLEQYIKMCLEKHGTNLDKDKGESP